MPLSGAAVVSSSPFSSARSAKQGSYVALLGDQHPAAFWGQPGPLGKAGRMGEAGGSWHSPQRRGCGPSGMGADASHDELKAA